jgi:3-oxoacyl-[acyl-carrier protein] reductase
VETSRLNGKIALVTGGSRGIGAATAKLLAAQGAQVAITYRSRADSAQAIVAEIRDGGGIAESYRIDLAASGQSHDLVQAVADRFGRIDVLVNNAGVFILRALQEIDATLFHELFNTNVLGPLELIQACLPHLPPRGGRIINVISSLALAPSEKNTLYGASKAALRAITQGYAGELGRRGATINALAPGVIMTDMMADAPKNALDQLAASTPAGRLGQPEDVAPLIAFLASDDSAWLNGRTLVADGGRLIF